MPRGTAKNRWNTGPRVLVQPPNGSTPVLVGESRSNELVRRGYVVLSSEPATSAPSYTTMKKAELVAEAESRGLDGEGTVAELVARLEEDDEA